jgi:putative ABC transport system permease protein
VVKALHRKLWRDVWRQRTQVMTIALVLASAVSGFAGSLGTYHSLIAARDAFYASAAFADLFVEAKRVPNVVQTRLAAMPGVARVDTTVVFDATLDVPGVVEPVIGRLVGLPERAGQSLDSLVLREGRLPSGAREVVVSEGFARVRALGPGSGLHALVNGRRASFTVVGVGLAPDYIFATPGGAFPDDRNFAVLWMDREPLSKAYNIEGAFNHAVFQLAPDADPQAVMASVDRLLEPYGGLKTYGRSDQPSHRILDQEINQWRVIGTVLPSVFLAVAAFLLNVVQNRQVRVQREQIAALKALGYDNASLARHYLGQSLVVLAIGLVVGIPIAYWFGSAVTRLYADFFHFPAYAFSIPGWTFALVTIVAVLGTAGGAVSAVLHVVRLAPAEAMHPPHPGRYRRTLLERMGLGALAGPVLRMMLRNIERRPWRATLTVVAIGSAMAIVVTGLFWRDALDLLIHVQFDLAQRADLEVAYVEPRSDDALREIARLPGVLRAEGVRSAPVELVAGPCRYRTSLLGVAAGSELRRSIGADLRDVPLPADGLLLTDRLAERLAVAPGDVVEVEFLTGERAHTRVRVAGTLGDLVGLNAYMSLESLDRIAGEGPVQTGATVRVAEKDRPRLLAQLKLRPGVATAASKGSMLQNFRDTSARNILFFTSVLTVFATVIAVGVVYNHARIALQERSWELASLRVLGFTRGEVSVFLLGELALEMLVAMPVGALLAYALAWTIVHATHSDLIAIPVVIAPRTYVFAGAVIALAGVASALIVRRRVDRLDLVAALKTRE